MYYDTSRRLIIIDSSVDGYERWLNSLRSTNTDVLVLDKSLGGLEQITNYLASGDAAYSNVEIVSYRPDGSLYLGSTMLTQFNIESYAPQLGLMSQGLTNSGDIPQHELEVAKGSNGHKFNTNLAALTGADAVKGISIETFDATTSSRLNFSGKTVNLDPSNNLAGNRYEGIRAQDFNTPTVLWTKLLGSTVLDFPTSLTTGADGAIYVAGVTCGNLDGQINNGGFEAFITRYNSDGTKAWTKLLETTSTFLTTSLTTGADGAIYLAGETSGNLYGETTNGYLDAFVIKLLVAADTTGPVVSTFSPPDGATDVLVGANIVLTFTEAIQKGTGSIVLKDAANNVVDTYDAATSTNMSISGSTLTINSTADLGYSTGYKVEFAAGSIKDIAGNSYAGTTSYNFTTGASHFSLSAGSSSVNEGSTATFNLITTNLTSGTSVPYTLSGVSADDVSGGSLSGNAVVNFFGAATISVLLLNDLLTEGAETLTLTAGGVSASTVVNDTSVSIPPTYDLQQHPAGTSANEGYTADFAVTTKGVTSGSVLTFTISGSVNAADITTGSLTGQATVGINGVANISIPIAADTLIEGPETLTVTVKGQSSSITINDTSNSPLTLDITSSASALKADQTATITFIFSEAPTGFAASDVTTTGGTLSTPTVSSTDTKVYTATFTPQPNLASGTASITVASASYTDAFGNSGGAGTTPTISIDTLAPTVATFSPADEATAVAIGANIVFTFSEEVQRGSGNIVVKTAAGVVVATYDAATSTNMSISGSTLTINPTADLGYSTGYKVEFAAGSIKDIAGNSYAGTTSHNFTTVPPPEVTVAVSESGSTNLVFTLSRTGDTSSALTVSIDLAGTAGSADYTSNLTPAPAIAWTKLLGTSNYDQATALTTGLDGSIYVSGVTDGALDGQTNSGGGDAFLTKLYISQTITFAAGASTATLVVDPTADSVLEGNETVVVTVLAGTGYALGPTISATGTIDSAPTVTTFSPTDGATDVLVGANIVLTFGEAIQKGTGSIVLKDSANKLVVTFDAATSTRLTFSGNTLTIDPTNNLAGNTK
jgi:methionine-rich copper-binding protein CopC